MTSNSCKTTSAQCTPKLASPSAAGSDAESTQMNGYNSTDVLGLSEYFMSVAVLSKQMSSFEEFQVGACIVNKDNRIVATGHNDLPNILADKVPPWEDTSSTVNDINNKEYYVCHAELNAVMNKTSADLVDCTIYVTLFPCNECAKVIIQAGIREVVFLSLPEDKARKTKYIASRLLLEAAGIRVKKFKNERRHVIAVDLHDS